MTYGSAIVPQTGHWLLSAGPFCHAIPVGNNVGIDLDSTTSVNSGCIAIHHGTFQLGDDAVDNPKKRLLACAPRDSFLVLANGQSVTLQESAP